MIESIEFRNFRALRNAKLKLRPFTLIVGPNGSGKSTALQGIETVRIARQEGNTNSLSRFVSLGARASEDNRVGVAIKWDLATPSPITTADWWPGGSNQVRTRNERGEAVVADVEQSISSTLDSFRTFVLNPSTMTLGAPLEPGTQLTSEGGKLAVVLDGLRDTSPERFEALNEELCRWLPEFNRILFDTMSSSQRAFVLRTREGNHRVPANQLSHGTILSLGLLTLAYLPSPPHIIGLEDPDQGIHPRLLRQVRDAIYRLAYPASCNEDRAPVQVIATTHSPYFLDLFRDRPEEIVIAEKHGMEARFGRLADQPHLKEILADAPLGEVWYSGVLGGVPLQP